MTTERLVRIEHGEQRLREVRNSLNWSEKHLIDGLPELSKLYMRQALMALEAATNSLQWAKESLPEYVVKV